VLAAGFRCGLHKIERLMRAQALRARPRRRGLPKDHGERHPGPMPSNILDRQFAAARQNQKWVADFNYVWTAEGWLYVAVVIDLFSRRVVGWSMSSTMTAQLVTGALVISRWLNGRISQYCARRAAGCGRLADRWGGARRRSRASFDEIRQRAVVGWSIGQPPRSGMPSGLPGARSLRSWRPMRHCGLMCRNDWLA
jgi:hypothetical protein